MGQERGRVENEIVVIDDLDGDCTLDGRHSSLPGMDRVIVTITGYKGIERAKLVALINRTGALFSGTLSSCHTHLVCWNFSGKKYQMSRNLGIKRVNHRWFEDCLRAGRRIPEEHYIRRCGEEVGPVRYEERTKVCHVKDCIRSPQQTQTSYLKDLDSMLEAAVSETCGSRRKKASKTVGKENQTCRPKNHSGEGESYLKELDDFLQQRVPVETANSASHQKERLEAFQDASSRENTSRKRPVAEGRPAKIKVHKPAPNFFRLKQAKVDAFLQPASSPDLGPPRNEAVSPIEAENLPTSTSTSRRLSTSSSSSEDVSCVICHNSDQTYVEGVLQCGHKFCFDCIKKWGHQSRSETPSCPLCKAAFDFITMREPFISLVEDDQNKKYVETIVMIGSKNKSAVANEIPETRSCIICHGSDAMELLLVCHVCNRRAVHSFCLDPPRVNALYPWECRVCLEQGRYRF